MSNIQKSFSKSSQSYNQNSFIQKDVAKTLVQKIPNLYPKVADIGCGDGAVIQNINWNFEKFLAVDFSKEMLELHKKDKNIEIFKADFDDDSLFQKLADEKYDILISSSAFQWSKNIYKLFKNIEKLNIPTYISIFTNKTFNEIHKYFEIQSPITSTKDILNSASNFKFEIIQKEVKFKNSLELLQYIKKSGVSGGENIVPNNKIRNLISSNKIHSITLEIIFLWKN